MARSAGALLACAAGPALAQSFGGNYGCSASEYAVFVGVAVAVPSATLLAIFEAVHRRRAPTRTTEWVSGVAGAVTWLIGIGRLSVEGNDATVTIFCSLLVAPLLLVLATAGRPPWLRALVVAAALGVGGLLVTADFAADGRLCLDRTAFVAGIVLCQLCVWTVVWWACHRERIAEDLARFLQRAPGVVDATLRRAAHEANRASDARVGRAPATRGPEMSRAPRSGAMFFVDALVIFAVLGIAIELGYSRGWHALLQIEWALDFFAWPALAGQPVWWSWRGVLCSLAGAAALWSAGSYLGWFDVGRFRRLRPAVLVVIGLFALVVANLATQIASVDAAERAASGLPPAP